MAVKQSSQPLASLVGRFAASTTLTIARHSFKEAVRKRLLVVTGLFALVLIATAPSWPTMSDEDLVKLVEDVSLTAMTFLGIIIAVFISAYSLPSDIDEKRIFTLATKPVHRHQILLGKFLGFLALFAVVLALMGAFSNVVIRSVSTYSRVEVTAGEAAIHINGQPVGAAGKGRTLRVLKTDGKFHHVVLPDDLVINEAAIAAADVEADRTTRQLTVKAETARLLYNGVCVAEAPKGTKLAMREKAGDSFVVILPANLRARKAMVPVESTSAPRWSVISKKRIVESAARIYRSRGLARYDRKSQAVELQIGVTVVQGDDQVREIWSFGNAAADLPPAGLPPDAKQVDVVLRVAGISGIVAGNAPGQDTKLDRFKASIVVLNTKTGQRHEGQIEALAGTKGFVSRFSMPREMLGGDLELSLVRITPAFHRDSPDQFDGDRTCTWRFRGLRNQRFPAGAAIRGEMQFEITKNGLPAHGAQAAEVCFRVSCPSDGRSEIVMVPARNGKPVEFAFSRDLVSPDGRVDIKLESVPRRFAVGVSAKDNLALRLLARPASFEWSYGKAVLLVFCQVMLVSGATISASTFVSGGVAALVGFFVYFCGLLAGFARDLLINPTAYLSGHHHGQSHAAEGAGASWEIGKVLLKVFVNIVPDVNKLDGKAFILKGLDVPNAAVVTGAGITILYVAIFMAIAYVIFRRKEFG